MDTKKLRLLVNMSQRDFANYFGIPLGTVRNWEQGIAKPPEYVFQMIETSIRRDKMINVETIKFVKLLDKLAELTENGIEEFANATQDNYDEKIFYDVNSVDADGRYKIVLDSCLLDDPECYHHDAISYYKSTHGDYSVRVEIDEDNKPFVVVSLTESDEMIVIEDGEWYFC